MSIRLMSDAALRCLASWGVSASLKNAAVYNGTDYIIGTIVYSQLSRSKTLNKWMGIKSQTPDADSKRFYKKVIVEVISRATGLGCALLTSYALKHHVRLGKGMIMSGAGLVGSLIGRQIQSSLDSFSRSSSSRPQDF